MSLQGSPLEAEAQPGLATADLRREHKIILRALTVLERAGRRIVAGRSMDDTVMKDLVELLRVQADQCHHGKEEGYLFPSMKAKGIPPDGPIARMLAAHSEGRDYLGTLAGLPSRAERAAAALLYVQVMREHIAKEDATVFPAADQLFSPEEQATLAQCYRDMEVRAFGTGFRESVLAELDRIERAIPA